MFDEMEPVDAGGSEPSEWQPMDWRILDRYASSDLSDQPVSPSIELIDQVFDDIDALLQEALA